MLVRQTIIKTAHNRMLVMLCILCFASISLAQQGWETKAPMPTARGWFSTSIVNNNIYAVGGATEIGSNLDVLEAFDPNTNTWTTKAPMPTPRGCLSTCTVDGIIYAIGGGWYTVYSTVEAYDPSNDTWTTKSPMPTARSGLSVCEVDGIIYAISGFDDINSTTGPNTVEAYDPKTDTWTTKAPIPTPRAFFSTSVVNGIIYAFGGFNSRGAPSLSNVEAYDTKTDTWTTKNDLQNPRAGMATCEVDGIIYAFGGVAYGGGSCYSTMSKYNPALDSWTELPDMPYGVGFHSNSIVDGKIYLIGGVNTLRDPLATVYEYTPAPVSNIEAGYVSGTWTLYGSPYYVNGEITIPNDSTLIVEPGVEVIFTGHYNFFVKGRLLAIGTEQDSIMFTAADPDTGWQGIRLFDIVSSNDSTIFEYCSFQYGKNGNGGAIYSRTDKLRISHCFFRNNVSLDIHPFAGTGGAIYIADSKPIIEYSEFCSNKAEFNGSALYILNSSDAIIRNNHFHHNLISATIAIKSSSLIFINNLIEQNHSNDDCILFFRYDSGNAKIINNTIVNNTCAQGAILSLYGLTSFINNIIYGNEPSQVTLRTSSSISFYNCLIEGGREGFTGATFTGTYENCIDSNPLFIDEAKGNYHLSDNSPCIGAGYYEEGLTPTCDCEGNLRPIGSSPDIGAYENSLDSPTHVEEHESQAPTKYALSQNYPNPFNPSTTIKYTIPSLSVILSAAKNLKDFSSQVPQNDNVNVTLRVYDILGREATALVDEKQKPGYYEIEWNASDKPSGVYFYKLSAGNYFEIKKMILLK
jgi:N-acetylneuraminic acid mutarotase